ncbi:helix-turn-helix domain-containing protein [Weizmannia acidilactici]|uniref:helix-turn-helix domain-containing protein n=1 Tax=Weizmannia acidilactici TaxID=2607726 RepID=UPI00124D3359|nr:helix-turn-helix transcriptional regulator [Weizmannia acidilactici]GER74827.1 hypothetical protein BpPP18_28940 [Weizmannia acidilactici]
MQEQTDKYKKVDEAVKNFGGVVHDFRIMNHLTLQDLAELVFLSASYLWRIENNKRNPDLDVRVRILTSGLCWSTEEIHLYLRQLISKEEIK